VRGSSASRKFYGHVRRHAVGYLALFVALGGTAVALPGRNSVDSRDIKPKNVRRSDLAPGSVNAAKIKDSAVNSAKIQDGAVAGSDVANDSLTGQQVDETSLHGVNADTVQSHGPLDFAAPQMAHLNMTGAATQEFSPVGYSTGANANFDRVVTAPAPLVMRDFRVDPLELNGGSGTAWNVSVFTNGLSNTDISCVVNVDDFKSCTDPDTFLVPTGHVIGIHVFTVGSPTNAEFAVSWRAAAP
jgi:hypothetical protein